MILLTMHEDEDLLNESLDLGVQGYVLKESAVEDLVQAIRAAGADIYQPLSPDNFCAGENKWIRCAAKGQDWNP